MEALFFVPHLIWFEGFSLPRILASCCIFLVIVFWILKKKGSAPQKKDIYKELTSLDPGESEFSEKILFILRKYLTEKYKKNMLSATAEEIGKSLGDASMTTSLMFLESQEYRGTPGEREHNAQIQSSIKTFFERFDH